MSRMTASYHIGKSTRVCAATGRTLENGEACIAALVHPLGAEAMSRVEYSLAAWEEGARPPTADLLGFWKARIPEEGEKRRVLIDDQSLVELFGQMTGSDGEDGSPRRDSVRFILALILLRKRLLTHNGGDATFMTLRARGQARTVLGDEPVTVVDPRLSDAQVGEVTAQLESIMAGDPEAVPA